MMKTRTLFPALALVSLLGDPAGAQSFHGPDTVVVSHGPLRLRALLWRPSGTGQFPGVLFNHGSGLNPERQPQTLGPTFASQGYVFMILFRRGQGLSIDQGAYSGALLDRQLADSGEDAHNRMHVRLLETDHLDDALAGLAFLRSLPIVDPRRVVVIGHSYGGALSLLLAERDSSLRVAIDFAGGARSWNRSAPLRDRLLAAVARTIVPTFFIYAANDYSVTAAEAMTMEMKRGGKVHRLKIFPPFGQSPADGHNFVYLGVQQWKAEVFAFLAQQLGS